MVMYHDKFPSGKVKEIVTKSDHLAVILNINVPYLKNIEVKFDKFQKITDLDFKLIDETLECLCEDFDWENDVISCFGQYDIDEGSEKRDRSLFESAITRDDKDSDKND